jgi:hypothetical protein
MSKLMNSILSLALLVPASINTSLLQDYKKTNPWADAINEALQSRKEFKIVGPLQLLPLEK